MSEVGDHAVRMETLREPVKTDGLVEREDREVVRNREIGSLRFALIAITICFGLACSLLVLEWRDDEVRTLVFAVKDGEIPILLGEPEGVPAGSDAVVEAMLREFVRVGHRVSSDRRILDQDFTKAQNFLVGGALARFLADVRSERNPYEAWQRGLMVAVEVESVVAADGAPEGVYVIDWIEREINRNTGAVKSIEKWRATATVRLNRKGQDRERVASNAGIEITSWVPTLIGKPSSNRGG